MLENHSTGFWDRRTADEERDFQNDLANLQEHETDSLSRKPQAQTDHGKNKPLLSAFHLDALQASIDVSDDEPAPPRKLKKTQFDKDAKLAARLHAQAVKQAEKESLKAVKRANRTIKQAQRQASHKKAVADRKFACSVAAKRHRRTLALSGAFALGYCRLCYAKLAPAFLKCSISPGNYDLYIGAVPFLLT
jgi:hypothetical protein